MKKNNKKGFTLVELVIVVAVMAILVAVAIPTVSSITAKAKSAVDKTNCEAIESMIKLGEANAIEAAGGGAVTYDTAAMTAALNNAKLGIDSGTFFYNKTTGAVTTEAPTGAGVTYVTITYSAGGATCS